MTTYDVNTIRAKPKPEKVVKVKKVKRKTDRKLLVDKLDHLVREIVLDRDVHCVCPPPQRGHGNVLQAGHLISRTKESVRWSLINVHCQCNSCNILHEHFPHVYTNSFITKFGQDEYWLLCYAADKSQKLQLYELQELLFQMKEIRQKQLYSILDEETYKPYYTQADILSGAWRTK